MYHGEPELLFYKHDSFQVIEAHRQQAGSAVTAIHDDRMLKTPTEDLVAEILRGVQLDVPRLAVAEAFVDQREGQVPVRDQFKDYGGRGVSSVTGTIVELSIPFEGDKDFFFIRPSTFDTAPPRAIVTKEYVIVRVIGRDLNPDQVKASLDGAIADIEKYLGWHRSTADPFNASLPQVIRNAVEARKAKLLKDRDMVASLGFNLKPRPGAAQTFAAPIKPKRIDPRPAPQSTAPFKPEPTLDLETYKQILDIMENMAVVMERAPSSFEALGEEGIRQHFLMQLNGSFQGAASGETFNYTGKTDILIRIDGKNIFIAECKFWGGEKAFLETIDQLLGYLSWRDTKTAVVIFNRNKDFSAVLKTMMEATDKHPHKKRGPEKESETRFRYVFGSPSDHSREVVLTVMAFDVPK